MEKSNKLLYKLYTFVMLRAILWLSIQKSIYTKKII